MHHIVKYNNRKLYSKNLSSYLSLEDIRDLIVIHEPFVVTLKDGTDITKETIERVVADLVVCKGKVNEALLKALIISAFPLEVNKEEDYTIN
jgi:polyhydroxyalkanoate synthesis regulator protein